MSYFTWKMPFRYKLILLAIAVAGIIVLARGFYKTYMPYKTDNSGNSQNAQTASGVLTDEFGTDTKTPEGGDFENFTPPFTFHYPAGFAVTRVPGEGGEALLVKKSPAPNSAEQNLQSGKEIPNSKFEISGGSEFQIYISPYDDDISTFTLERIRADIPDIVIQEPQEILIAKDKSEHALMFFSPNGGGRTREIWFVYPV